MTLLTPIPETANTAGAASGADPAAAAGAVGWVRRLRGYVLRHRRDVAVSLGAAVASSVCLAVVPLVERQIVNGVIVQRDSRLWPWLVLLLVLGVAAFGFSYLRRFHGSKVALLVQLDLRNDIHDRLQEMDFANLDQMPTGQLVGRANSDSTLVQAFLGFLPTISGNVLLMLFSLVIMLYLCPLLAVVSLVIAPLLLWARYRMRRTLFPATWDAQQREGDVAQIVDEDINGVRVVKAFAQEHHELQRLTTAAESLYGAQMRTVRLQARYNPLLQAIPSIGQVAILALGGWLALHHDISLGTFLAFSTYFVQMVSPARQLAGILTVAQLARTGLERIVQILDRTPAIRDAPTAITLPPIQGDIDFRDVAFGYDPDHTVLDGIDLHIRPGERVALVGASGSGKSTLTLLIDRFYDPETGSIRIDGHDLRQVSLQSLRSQIGVVFEDSFLFSDSIRTNIAYGRPEATDAQIQAAARVAQAEEFILALPRGYDTMVGERGLTLSGGQRQRIALARAVVADPRILILDDATSAIDATVEEAIHHGLRDVLVDRTTILIAHRQSTLHLAERIIVLDHGRIAAQGTHDQLLANNALYRRLLTGLDQQPATEAGDRIEALATLTPSTPPAGSFDPAGVTAAAWGAPSTTGRAGGGSSSSGSSSSGSSSSGSSSSGSSSSGSSSGGAGNWRRNLAPTPQLLAQVAALPPVRDQVSVDLASEARPDPVFGLRRLLGQFRRPLLLGLALVVVDAVASLAGPILVKTGINDGVTKGSQLALFTAAGIYLAVTLVDYLTEIADTFVTGRTAQRIMLSLRVRIWAQLQRLSLDFYESEMSGRIMTRMTTDVDQFESLIEDGVLTAVVSFVTFLGVGVALVLINLELGLLTLTVTIPLAVATVLFRNRSARLYDTARERIALVNSAFQETISGIQVVQAFTHETQTATHFHTLGQRYLHARVAAQRLVAVYFPFVQFLSAVADVIILGVGADLIAHGHLTSGALIAFLLYIDMFFSPIQELSQVFDAWQQTKVSLTRVADLMALQTLTPDTTEPLAVGRLHGHLQLTDIRFTYRPITPASSRPAAARRGPKDPRDLRTADATTQRPPEAIRGLNLDIAAGETIALVGQTGAGKSTVMKLLARFYDPDHGSIRIDGHDLRQLALHDYRSQLGYVPQESFLFSTTIRDNIAYGRPEATDAEIEHVARTIGAHDFIADLPGGYLHHVSERGRSLSAGQRQLIALARAHLINPAILLLDEATANLDVATETRVTTATNQLAHGRTTILIAHRLQTAQTADRIAVLHNGTITETGTHDQLRAQNGRYAAMWNAYENASGGD